MTRGKCVAGPCAIERVAGVGSEAVRVAQREVPLHVVHRVADGGRGVVPRQQHGCTEIDGSPPELRERRTLKAESLHPLVVGRHLDGRDDVRRAQPNGEALLRVDRDALHVAVEVARRACPVLPLPLVVVHPEHVSVGSAEFRVDVHEALHPVLAGGDVAHVPDRVAEVALGDDGGAARRQGLDVVAEERDAQSAGLQPRLAVVGARDHDIDAAGEGLGADRGGDGDLKVVRCSALGGEGRARGGDGQDSQEGRFH